MRSLVTLLLVLGLVGGTLLGITFWRNDLPWTSPPGVLSRLVTYTTTHVAETIDGSPFPELRPRRYPGVTPDQLYGYVVQAVRALPGWRIQPDPTARVVRAVVTTPLVHFEDDVAIAVTADAARAASVLKVHAESRVGQGDLGTNTAHILRFYHALDRVVPPPPAS